MNNTNQTPEAELSAEEIITKEIRKAFTRHMVQHVQVNKEDRRDRVEIFIEEAAQAILVNASQSKVIEDQKKLVENYKAELDNDMFLVERLRSQILEIEKEKNLLQEQKWQLMEMNRPIVREVERLKTELHKTNMNMLEERKEKEIEALVKEFQETELPNRNEAFHYEAEINAGLNEFLRWIVTHKNGGK